MSGSSGTTLAAKRKPRCAGDTGKNSGMLFDPSNVSKVRRTCRFELSFSGDTGWNSRFSVVPTGAPKALSGSWYEGGTGRKKPVTWSDSRWFILGTVCLSAEAWPDGGEQGFQVIPGARRLNCPRPGCRWLVQGGSTCNKVNIFCSTRRVG